MLSVCSSEIFQNAAALRHVPKLSFILKELTNVMLTMQER